MKNFSAILGLVWAALGVIPLICLGCEAVTESAASLRAKLPAALPSLDGAVILGFIGIFILLCLTEKIIDGTLARARKFFTSK